MSSGQAHVVARDIEYRYGFTIALDGLNLDLDTGVTALLGPNGAGKTTLMSILTGSSPSRGSVRILGESLTDRRQRKSALASVGYLPQRFDLHGTLTVGATARYAAWANGMTSREALGAGDRALQVVELHAKAHDRVRTLSGGERQRLGLACAIAHRPKVLLLDEPTVGLDPQQRVSFRSYLRSLSTTTCVLLSTHLLDDVSTSTDRVVVIGCGRDLFVGTPQVLAARGGPKTSELETDLESGYRVVLTEAQEDIT